MNDFKIGTLVRAWRQKRNLIQKELAGAVGMNTAQLWSIENDRNSPSVRTVARIADALRITLPELLSPPPEDGLPSPPVTQPQNFKVLQVNQTDLVQILRTDSSHTLDQASIARLGQKLAKAVDLENHHQVEVPTDLPFAFPFSHSESGAAQLARAVRAHLDVGSAIIHDVRILFETHGVRILEVTLPGNMETVTFYNPVRRNFTIFLSHNLIHKPWRRDFAFLSEIGRAFLFADNYYTTYRESDRSRRFARHFAAAFLQPEQAVRAAVYSLRVQPNDWTYELLLRLKNRFGVSAETFNIRLKELCLISHKKHNLFAKTIKDYYAANNYDEPQPSSKLPQNRIGDLLAARSQTDGSPPGNARGRGRSSLPIGTWFPRETGRR